MPRSAVVFAFLFFPLLKSTQAKSYRSASHCMSLARHQLHRMVFLGHVQPGQKEKEKRRKKWNVCMFCRTSLLPPLPCLSLTDFSSPPICDVSHFQPPRHAPFAKTKIRWEMGIPVTVWLGFCDYSLSSFCCLPRPPPSCRPRPPGHISRPIGSLKHGWVILSSFSQAQTNQARQAQTHPSLGMGPDSVHRPGLPLRRLRPQ